MVVVFFYNSCRRVSLEIILLGLSIATSQNRVSVYLTTKLREQVFSLSRESLQTSQCESECMCHQVHLPFSY
jgi:hypothetical protein